MQKKPVGASKSYGDESTGKNVEHSTKECKINIAFCTLRRDINKIFKRAFLKQSDVNAPL